ncbi:phosphoribosyltransferase [Agromyces aureus]|uniref:Phosphoribosyltransferase n=1 Tax=Agromyces aureus TaxID=453304 RepID=A0A191WHF3_9MICO|nr:phosphoribosyltransferase [Agromyces aureus]ANJ27609.1 phosphoribosyltransferase [Agromyces aureus]
MTFDANDAGTTGDGIRREILTWDDFAVASRQVAADVLGSGFRPDVVIAIARGGLLFAGAIAYALGTKACGSINVEFYSGVDERLPEPVLHPPMLDAPALSGKRVLLVDDVSDSGRTLAKVVGILGDAGADVRSATLYTKSHTVLEPDFDYKRTDDWIVFPWSALPPVQVPDVVARVAAAADGSIA